MMSSAAPRIVRREVIYSGYVTLERLLLRLDDGKEIWREVESHGDSVAVLPYDPVRRTTLTVRQYRAPAISLGGVELLEEACAGMIDAADGDVKETVRREAFEELGLRLAELESIGWVWTSPGVVAERSHLFLAPYSAADHVNAGGGLAEEDEAIEVVETSLSGLAAAADAGAIRDAKLLMLIQSLRIRRPALFE